MIATALLYIQVAFGGAVYTVPVSPVTLKAPAPYNQVDIPRDLPVCAPYELDLGPSSVDTSA